VVVAQTVEFQVDPTCFAAGGWRKGKRHVTPRLILKADDLGRAFVHRNHHPRQQTTEDRETGDDPGGPGKSRAVLAIQRESIRGQVAPLRNAWAIQKNGVCMIATPIG
jgi:hypothetical protein